MGLTNYSFLQNQSNSNWILTRWELGERDTNGAKKVMYGLFVIMLAGLPRGLDAAMVFEFSSELHRPSSSWTVYDITTGAGVSGTRNPPTKQKSIFWLSQSRLFRTQQERIDRPKDVNHSVFWTRNKWDKCSPNWVKHKEKIAIFYQKPAKAPERRLLTYVRLQLSRDVPPLRRACVYYSALRNDPIAKQIQEIRVFDRDFHKSVIERFTLGWTINVYLQMLQWSRKTPYFFLALLYHW